MSSIPTGKRTDQITARRAGQGRLPVNPRALLAQPRPATIEAPASTVSGFDPSHFTPELLSTLDLIDSGAQAADFNLRPGPTQQAAILNTYEQAAPERRAMLRREYTEIMNGRNPDPLAKQVADYERENPALTHFAQRLEGGTYDALRSVAAMRAADLASFNPELSALLDRIDQGARPRDLGLTAGPSVLKDLSLQYYGAGPEERAELRQSYADEFAGQVGAVIDYGEKAAAIPRNPVVAATTEALNAGEFGKAWDAFSTDPIGFIAQIGVESFPRSVPGLVASPLLTPPVAFGLSSGASEYGSAIVQGLADAGVDMRDPAALSAALSDPAIMASVRENATRRALVIGGFDALSGGLAGRTLAPSVMSPLARQAVNIPVQSVAQGALGAAGEAGAQVATGQDIRLGDVAAEFAGEFVGAPGEVTAAAVSMRSRGRPRLRYLKTPPAAGAAVPGAPPAAVPPAAPSAPTASQASPQPPVAAPPMESAPATLPDDFTPNAAPAAGDVVVTPSGRRVGVQYQVVDLDSITPSHTDDMSVNPRFPAELQPRERGRAASQAQIAEIAGNIQPELLGRSSSAAEGAPIIGPDGLVESGNARVLALRRAYQHGGAGGYRQWLQGQGFNVEGIASPVLVRVRTSDMSPQDRIAFTTEANQRTTLAPGAAEQAAADARAMSPALVESYRGGDLTAAANRSFVRSFIDAIIPASERGSVVGPDGSISQDGLRRVENAVFSRAYSDPRVLSALREDTDSNIKAIGAALIDAAPGWMKLRADVAAGRVPAEMNITPALIEAVNVVSRARREGMLVSDIVTQRDMLGGGVSPEAQAVLRLMYSDPKFRRPVSRQRLASALSFYADQARKAAGGGFDLGDTQATPEAILELARNRGTGELFGEAAEMRAPAEELPATAALPATANMEPGNKWKGFVSGLRNADVPRRNDIFRREQIISDLIKGFDIPLYSGRIKSKHTLGFYRKHIQELRIKYPSDVEVVAHELFHHLDDLRPEIRSQWRQATRANADFRKELRGVSYDKESLTEGWAEFGRLWLTQPQEAQSRAPTVYAWWEKYLPKSGHEKVLRHTQKQIIAWFRQNALDRARSKIGEAKAVNEALDRPLDRFRQAVFDDFHGIGLAEKKIAGTVHRPQGAYRTARLTRAAASITNGMLKLGRIVVNDDGSHSYTGKGLDQILKPVADRIDDWVLYAVGVSADELRGQGRENLFTPTEIEAMVGLETPEFKKAFGELQEWQKSVVDFAQAKGIINPAFRRSWRRAQYLPFHRVGDAAGGFSPVPGDWRGIKALTGGSQNIKDVLSNIISNAAMLVEAGLVNEARQKAVNLSQMLGGAKIMARIPTEEAVVKFHVAEVQRAILEALGVKSIRALEPDAQEVVEQIVDNMGPMVSLTMRGLAPKGRDVIAVLDQGKPTYYEVPDPILFKALTAFKRERPSMVRQVLNAFRRLGQTTITLTPQFMLANVARDQLSAGIMSNHGYVPFMSAVRGFVSRVTKDEVYREYIANGGGMASFLVSEGAYKRQLQSFYSRRGVDIRAVITSPVKLLDALETLAEYFEMATRLGEYRRAVGRGEHPRDAAYYAREVSVDFSMRGDNTYATFVYDAVPFLRAAMVSLDRLYRGVVVDPNRGKAIVGIVGLALASQLLYLFNRGIPEYERLEDWQRDTSWPIPIPNAAYMDAMRNGTEPPPPGQRFTYVLFPKIFEIGAVASIAERALESFLDGQPEAVAGHAARILMDVFSLELMPQIVAPVAEVWANRDTFTNRTIETQDLKALPPWARSRTNTSETVRAIGEATRELPESLQLSPVQVEHVLRGYLNGFATYGLMIPDAIFFDDAPDMKLSDLPLVRRFVATDPAVNTKYLSQLYDMIDEITMARREVRFLVRQNEPEEAREIIEAGELEAYKQMTVAEKRLQAFRKQVRGVYGIKDLANLQDFASRRARSYDDAEFVSRAQRNDAWDDLGALKRFLLDDILRRRNEFAEQMMKRLEEKQP